GRLAAPYNRRVRWWKFGVAAASVGLVTAALRLFSVANAGIAAPLLLLDVVVMARLFGFGAAMVAGGCGAAAYSYFFLPPAGFGIEKPEDLTAFITFSITALVAGGLASRPEPRAGEARQGRDEIERLYQELKAAFESASESEAARRNETLKAALLDAMRHNLRTPLTAIKAAVTALLGSRSKTLEPSLPEEDRFELLQVIDEET